MPRRRHNLLALSDVHLGSDLVQHVRPGTPARSATSARRDSELVALLAWYREHRVGDLPWRLVIGGDFIDFAGMSVMPARDELAAEPTAEERTHGLGSTRDHTLTKVELVFEHHSDVMQSLADFLASGNTLVIVRGNHDVDWHWRAVQRDFRRRLGRLAAMAPGQITFAPWFYYEEGVVYVEHGHQYDSACSYDHVLFPVSPADPRRTARSLSDVLLRYVVRPTPGMPEAGHETATLFHYVGFAVRLGASGLLALAQRFASAIGELFRMWRESLDDAASRVKGVHEQRMRALGAAYRIQLERLQSLARLQRPPITRSFFGIFRSVMLDQLLMGVVAISFAVTAFALARWSVALPVTAGVMLLLELVRRASHRTRGLEPSAVLRESSARVAKLFPAAFVVMGHTHLPEMRASAECTTYVNLGAWSADETPEGPVEPGPRTHFVLAQDGDGLHAELRAWDGVAPLPFEPVLPATSPPGGRRG